MAVTMETKVQQFPPRPPAAPQEAAAKMWMNLLYFQCLC